MSYILNTCRLVSFDVNKEKVDTLFPDCSNILEHWLDASPDADVFVTYGASVMTVAKGVMVVLSLKKILWVRWYIHCIYHRLALAWAIEAMVTNSWMGLKKTVEILQKLIKTNEDLCKNSS